VLGSGIGVKATEESIRLAGKERDPDVSFPVWMHGVGVRVPRQMDRAEIHPEWGRPGGSRVSGSDRQKHQGDGEYL